MRVDDASIRRDDRAKRADARSAFVGDLSARAHVVEALGEEGSVARHDVSKCVGVIDVRADDVSEEADAVSVFRDERATLGHVVHLSREDVSALVDVGPLSSRDLSEHRQDLPEQ